VTGIGSPDAGSAEKVATLELDYGGNIWFNQMKRNHCFIQKN